MAGPCGSARPHDGDPCTHGTPKRHRMLARRPQRAPHGSSADALHPSFQKFTSRAQAAASASTRRTATVELRAPEARSGPPRRRSPYPRAVQAALLCPRDRSHPELRQLRWGPGRGSAISRRPAASPPPRSTRRNTPGARRVGVGLARIRRIQRLRTRLPLCSALSGTTSRDTCAHPEDPARNAPAKTRAARPVEPSSLDDPWQTRHLHGLRDSAGPAASACARSSVRGPASFFVVCRACEVSFAGCTP